MSESEHNARILFVADGLPLLHSGARLLGDAGHQVIEAATGQEGLRLAQEWKPDLVLLGALLPDLNSVEVCRHIKADPQLAKTHIVMLSSTRAEPDSLTEALEAGCDDYITWPVPNQEILAHVEHLMRLKHTEQMLQKLAYELGKRVKELDCLYGISQLISRQGIQLQEILQGAVNLIPPAFRYPDAACVRISLDGQEFRTQNYRETAWRQVADLLAHGQRVGVLEVSYLEEKPETDEGPFLAEEAKFLQTVAEHLSQAAERLRAEEALQQRTAELEARNEELDAFAHTVAHDLQGLVGLVTGYAEVLAEDHTGFSDEEVKRCLSAVVHNGRKIRQIIDGLLLLAAARKIDVKTEPLGMPSIVAEAQHRLATMIAEYEAEMVVPDAWPAALGYGPWVEEVWVNYISNAILYGGRPPWVELGAEAQPDGMIRFWVQDNGSGLMPEVWARLFVPFTQLAHLHGKGHGLGLSIVQRIVDRLGGQVGVESEGVPGRGSIFSFTLPGVDGQSQDDQSS